MTKGKICGSIFIRTIGQGAKQSACLDHLLVFEQTAKFKANLHTRTKESPNRAVSNDLDSRSELSENGPPMRKNEAYLWRGGAHTASSRVRDANKDEYIMLSLSLSLMIVMVFLIASRQWTGNGMRALIFLPSLTLCNMSLSTQKGRSTFMFLASLGVSFLVSRRR